MPLITLAPHPQNVFLVHEHGERIVKVGWLACAARVIWVAAPWLATSVQPMAQQQLLFAAVQG